MEAKKLSVLKKLYKSAQYRGREVEKIFDKQTITPIDLFNILQYGLAMGGIMNISNDLIDYPTLAQIKNMSNAELLESTKKLNKLVGEELVRDVSTLFVNIGSFIEAQAKKMHNIMSNPPSNAQN